MISKFSLDILLYQNDFLESAEVCVYLHFQRLLFQQHFFDVISISLDYEIISLLLNNYLG